MLPFPLHQITSLLSSTLHRDAVVSRLSSPICLSISFLLLLLLLGIPSRVGRNLNPRWEARFLLKSFHSHHLFCYFCFDRPNFDMASSYVSLRFKPETPVVVYIW